MREITSIDEALDGVRLRHIRLVELHCDAKLGPLSDPVDDVDMPASVQVLVPEAENGLAVVLRISADIPAARVAVAALGEYEYDGPVRFTDEAAVEFVERLAFMQIWPYLREGFSMVTTLTRSEAPILPIVPAGDFKMPPGFRMPYGDRETEDAKPDD